MIQKTNDHLEHCIKVEGLKKTFLNGTVPVEVLKGLDFTIAPGEFVSIMGPSGSGKSTLLYLLGALDTSSEGAVLLNGKNLGSMKAREKSVLRRRELGFVFQFYNLVPNLTVEENILLPIILDGKPIKKYKKRLEELLHIIGMEDRRTHTPKKLSGGQQQRVAVARALIFNPDVLLLDEPTGNLDSTNSESLMKLIVDINRTFKTTVVQVTHSDKFAAWGHRIIHLEDGLLQKQA